MPFIKSVDTFLALHRQGFKPAKEADTKYFAAVGRLVVSFSANVDNVLNSCLRSAISSDEMEIPALLVGEMRGGEIIANLRRIFSTRKLPPATIAEMEQIFSEVEPLRRVRDIVAHRALLVKGSKLAFHNASIARTDAAVAVDIYTLTELSELTAYARRLGARIVRAFSKLHPQPMRPAQKATLGLFSGAILTATVASLLKDGSLSRRAAERLKEYQDRAAKAVCAYAEAVKQSGGPNLYDLEMEARDAIALVTAEISTRDAPEGAALLEIPARLQKPGRSPPAGKIRSQKRQRSSSRA